MSVTPTFGRAELRPRVVPPSVGRIVHYQSFGTPGGEYLPEARAAIITSVGVIGQVALAVLNPTGMFFNDCVPFAEEPTPGHWNWPPIVKAV